jgi:hypothetical protein
MTDGGGVVRLGLLLAARAPGALVVHVVDAALLDAAIARGVTPDVAARVAAHVDHLIASGARAVLVTCSSIGEAAEAAAAGRRVPVLRVDAAMATRAAAIATAPGAGGVVAVLATLEATLGPTGRLVARAVTSSGGAAGGRSVRVDGQVVTGAAVARAAGDVAGHDHLVAEAVRRVAGSADVVVLAQASMASAAGLAGVSVPVLTSPASGADALVAAVVARPAYPNRVVRDG